MSEIGKGVCGTSTLEGYILRKNPCYRYVCVNGVGVHILDKKGSGESVTRAISFL